MYIPVPCPNEEDGDEPTDIAEAAQGAVLSVAAAAAAQGLDVPPQIATTNALSQHAKAQKQQQPVVRKVDQSPPTSVASGVTQGTHLNSSLNLKSNGTVSGNNNNNLIDFYGPGSYGSGVISRIGSAQRFFCLIGSSFHDSR